MRKGFPNLGQKGFNRRKPLLQVRGSDYGKTMNTLEFHIRIELNNVSTDNV